MGTGVQWYFVGDELFLTHPGLGCAAEGAGSIPTTHSSYIPGHNGWGCISAPPCDPLLLLLGAIPVLVVWVKTSLPTTTPSVWVL